MVTVGELKLAIADQLARQQRFGGEVRNETVLHRFDHGDGLLKTKQNKKTNKEKTKESRQ